MRSNYCIFLLVLVFASHANSNPTVQHQTVPPPTVLPVEAAQDHGVVPSDFPVDGSGQKINCAEMKDCLDSVLGEFSECKGATCFCRLDSQQSATSKKCLPNRNMGEGCEEDQQCKDLGSAACIKNYCSCTAGAAVIDKKCWMKKIIGEGCSKDEECRVSSADTKCRDSICSCKDGMVPHSDGKQCLKVAEKVGDSCQETSQCLAELGGATCHKGSCKCLENHHEKNNGCIKNLYLGDRCGVNIEGICFLPNNFGETRVICKETCECRDGFTPSEDKKHCLEPGQKDPGTDGAASVHPIMAIIVTVVAALILTS